tara:strand:+ start:1488 stop:2111 length:624 start_codon:yes stop_codon:yes gene_type:complete
MEDYAELRLAAVVLAAGSSRRMGNKNKLLEKIKSKTMIRTVVSTLSQSSIDKILVVAGFQSDRLKIELEDMNIEVVQNDLFELGLSSSLKVGLFALPSNIDVAAIILGDMPFLKITEIHNLIAACTAGDERTIVVPSVEGLSGNPVLWPRYYWPEIIALEGDQGAQSLIAKYSDYVVTVAVGDVGCFVDIDTPKELVQYRDGIVDDC